MPKMKDPREFMQAINSANISGAVPNALNMIEQLKKVNGLNNHIFEALNPQDVISSMQQIMQQFNLQNLLETLKRQAQQLTPEIEALEKEIQQELAKIGLASNFKSDK